MTSDVDGAAEVCNSMVTGFDSSGCPKAATLQDLVAEPHQQGQALLSSVMWLLAVDRLLCCCGISSGRFLDTSRKSPETTRRISRRTRAQFFATSFKQRLPHLRKVRLSRMKSWVVPGAMRPTVLSRCVLSSSLSDLTGKCR